MTRKEALERQHQQSLESNGYATPRRSLADGPQGITPGTRMVKKTITAGLVLTLLWWAYRIGTEVWKAYHNDRAPVVEERAK